ncbi:hypothetical protein E2C01_059931 [Portunus trituberculatus]|uniref:Uncharacterized protein n=1 Tax=Portunus trituberculatus TaxID=210409 RepID=A0A5B7H7Y8_PORTR|nr:hypothetical protein [Portunus trituberculatus]
MLCTGSDCLKGSLTPLYHDPRTPTTPYLRKILGVLTSVGIAEAYINIVMSPLQLAWNPHHASLYALQSTSHMDCDLVNKCLNLIHALEGAGATRSMNGAISGN